ncbi:MAG: carbohydrate kinase, partial [Treponema sp.]|nr:carbohydrate kinase [Treponema sp.]
MAKYDVTTLGEILIDLTVVGKSENGSSLLEENPGGAPANVAASISKLGGKSAFIGKIGSDRFGDVALSALKNVGVDCSAVKIEERQRTSVSFVNLGKNGERTFSFERGADTLLSSSEVSENLIASSKFLHIGSLSLTEESASSATREAIKLAKKFGTFISYDPNWREVAWSDSSLGIKTM